MRPNELLEELETRAKKRLFERLKKEGKEILSPQVLINMLNQTPLPSLTRKQIANHYWHQESILDITPENVNQVLEPIEVFLRLLVELGA